MKQFTRIEIEEFANLVLEDLSYDNDFVFIANIEQWAALVAGLTKMANNGFELTPANSDQLAAGEVGETYEMFHQYPGFEEVDIVLNEIFNGE